MHFLSCTEDLGTEEVESGLMMADTGAIALYLLGIRPPKVLDGRIPSKLFKLMDKSPDALKSMRVDTYYSIKVLKKAGTF